MSVETELPTPNDDEPENRPTLSLPTSGNKPPRQKYSHSNPYIRSDLRPAQWVVMDEKPFFVSKGQRYFRWKSPRLREVAIVEGFYYDGYGILHIVYQTRFVQPAISASEDSTGGLRMIAFSTFIEHYQPEGWEAGR